MHQGPLALGCGLLLSLISPMFHARGSAADPSPQAIRMISYNIRYASPSDGPDRWKHRVSTVAEVIGCADVAGLQEVTWPQLQDLRERLPEFDWYGAGRNDGEKEGELSPVLFRRDRFELLDQGTFWLSESPETVGSRGWDAALPRVLSWVLLRDRQSNQSIAVASTHFDHRGSAARLESARLVRQRLNRLQNDLPVVLMGDFNCTPDSEPYRALVEKSEEGSRQLRDARLVTAQPPEGPQSTWNGFEEIVPDRIIDHVFVSGPVEVKQFEIRNPKTDSGRFASDHLPVFVSVVPQG